MKNVSLILLCLTLMFGCKKDNKPIPEPKPETREFRLEVSLKDGTTFQITDPIETRKQYKAPGYSIFLKRFYNVGQEVTIAISSVDPPDAYVYLRVLDVKANQHVFEKESKEAVSYSFTVN